MKASISIIVFLFTITFSFAQSKDQEEIRYLEAHWTALLESGEIDSLMKIWSKDYVVNNPSGKIVTPKEILALMESGHVFPKVERIIENITFNQNIAVVMGKELQQPGNMTLDQDEWIPRRFTNVWIKAEEGWKLASRQSSEMCMD